MKVKAYAKLNLYLNIVRVREDGYHELDMIMQEVDLADILTLTPATEITVDCPGVAQEKNLAYRAAKAFFQKNGIAGGVQISIEKHIPSEAGMGGGSSDAAAVLRALNDLYGKPLTEKRLWELALPLGADVPFAVSGGTARAQGIGEILTPIQNRLQVSYIIVKPRRGVPTGEAFRLADHQPVEIPPGNIENCICALETGNPELFAENTYNALTHAGKILCPEIQQILATLSKIPGCAAAFMTGSGSACVGMFPETADAESAQQHLKEIFPEAFHALVQNVTK